MTANLKTLKYVAAFRIKKYRSCDFIKEKEYKFWDPGTNGPLRVLKTVEHAFIYHWDMPARVLTVFEA